LMVITSLGIFGFLSRAHLEQSNPTEELYNQIKRIELRLEQYENRIKVHEQTISVLDKAFERYLELGAVTKGLEARDEQQGLVDAERAKIDQIRKEMDVLIDQKFEIQKNIDSIELEVGPIRYVASLIYDNVDNTRLEDAVRWVIIMLIFVFDPLAIVLVIAGNISLDQVKMDRQIELELYEEERRRTYDIPGDKKIIDQENISSIIEEEQSPIAVDEAVAVEELNDENVEIASRKDLSEKEKTWIMNKWKDKGFKSPAAYMSFLKKFE